MSTTTESWGVVVEKRAAKGVALAVLTIGFGIAVLADLSVLPGLSVLLLAGVIGFVIIRTTR